MKRTILVIAAFLVSANCIADSSFSKGSPQLKALGSAWKAHHSIQPNRNDITIVYGGEDVSLHKTTLPEHTIAV